jgi:hypothetical protein
MLLLARGCCGAASMVSQRARGCMRSRHGATQPHRPACTHGLRRRRPRTWPCSCCRWVTRSPSGSSARLLQPCLRACCSRSPSATGGSAAACCPWAACCSSRSRPSCLLAAAARPGRAHARLARSLALPVQVCGG